MCWCLRRPRVLCAWQSDNASNHLFWFGGEKIGQLILIIQGGDCWRLRGSRHRFCIEWFSSVKNTSYCGGVMFHAPPEPPCNYRMSIWENTSSQFKFRLLVDADLTCALNVNNVSYACKCKYLSELMLCREAVVVSSICHLFLLFLI